MCTSAARVSQRGVRPAAIYALIVACGKFRSDIRTTGNRAVTDKERTFTLVMWNPLDDLKPKFHVTEKPRAMPGSGYDYEVCDEAASIVMRGWMAGGLSPKQREFSIGIDLGRASERVVSPTEIADFINRIAGTAAAPSLAISSVIIPESKTTEGVLIRSTTVLWTEIVQKLGQNWEKAFEIDSTTWEEIIAGAFTKEGYDEVTLTPRTGDHGRDVIAIRKGVGSIKVIGSVKAYHPGLIVSYDHVRSLLGVMMGERDTSKGIITTTSDFPPKIMEDPFIAPFVPYRLELINGEKLQKWLKELVEKKG